MDVDDPLGPDLTPGARFGPYEIVRKLGEGGMGAVFEARRQGINKRVALKVLTVDGGAGGSQRFLREARISATLEHPNIVDCIDVGQHLGVPYLALEFLEGETLGAKMARGPLEVAATVDLLLPVCSALAHAHAHGVVHRDLKPDNIFLARKLGSINPKVLDFGIAKVPTSVEGPLTNTSAIMGTPAYMSPEQVRETKHVTAASDQFSLGVVIWEAVTGRRLFTGESSIQIMMRVVTERAAPLREFSPHAPLEFEAAVARMLSGDPQARFPSMHAVGAALLPFASATSRERWLAEFDVQRAASLASDSSAPHEATGGAHHVSVAPTMPADPSASRVPTTLSRSAASFPVRPDARFRPLVTFAFGGLVAVFALGAWRWRAPAAPVAPRSASTAIVSPARVPEPAALPAAPPTTPQVPAVREGGAAPDAGQAAVRTRASADDRPRGEGSRPPAERARTLRGRHRHID